MTLIRPGGRSFLEYLKVMDMSVPAIQFGKYELTTQIRENLLYTIFEGDDLEMGRVIQLARFDAERVPSSPFLRRFKLVSNILADLDPPGGVPILEVGEYDNQAFVVHPQIAGQTLAHCLMNNDNLSVDLVLDILQQVGDYLARLHPAEIFHGMIIPENILITPNKVIRIMGSGYAQGVNLSAGLLAGQLETLPYYAPELRAGESLTPETDFYALGAVLYAALTGELPELDLKDPYPGNKRAGIPPELDDLVAKCLSITPAQRVHSTVELLNGLGEVRRGITAGSQDTILGMEDALVGHTLGTYQLVERLGQGGMATVYRAYEPTLDRYVAIKILPQFFARDRNFTQRFRREARAVAQLDHPNIVAIHNYGEEGGITYIAMRLVEGGTLKQVRGQAYPPDRAIKLIQPIARALDYAHKRGIIHRDIKPANILIAEGDWPMLADFGLAKMAEASQKLTGTGVGVGTPMYMSPEQGQGINVDHRTDIYSLGIMLYEMLTGDVPFRADTPMGVVIKHITAPMPMPRSINPDIPEPLERIILKATAKSPDQRFQTANEMSEVLELMLHQLMVTEAPAILPDFEVPDVYAPTEIVKASEPQPPHPPLPVEIEAEAPREIPVSASPVIKEIICPACQTANPDDMQFCENCGKSLVSKESDPSMVTIFPLAINVCPSCATGNRPGVRFCENCGHELDEAEAGKSEESELTCPECNAKNRPGVGFCEECGHPLG
jgi:eukaryotic-like serine/threonine-protein kinase